MNWEHFFGTLREYEAQESKEEVLKNRMLQQ